MCAHQALGLPLRQLLGLFRRLVYVAVVHHFARADILLDLQQLRARGAGRAGSRMVSAQRG
jgi:hypothetical protein